MINSNDTLQISGGTGITPFIQLIHSIKETKGATRITLLHSSLTPSQLPPEVVLSILSSDAEHLSNFNFRLFVDSLGEKAAQKSSCTTFNVGRIAKQDIAEALGLDDQLLPASGEKTLILLCGPEQ